MPGPGTWVAGDILTAADLNAIGTWTTYTPTLRQNAATVTATVDYAAYCLINKMCVANVTLTATTSGTAAQKIDVSLPVNTTQTGNGVLGFGYFFDASANDIMLVSCYRDVTSRILFIAETTANTSNPLGVAPSVTIANGDVLSFSLMYQAV